MFSTLSRIGAGRFSLSVRFRHRSLFSGGRNGRFSPQRSPSRENGAKNASETQTGPENSGDKSNNLKILGFGALAGVGLAAAWFYLSGSSDGHESVETDGSSNIPSSTCSSSSSSSFSSESAVTSVADLLSAFAQSQRECLEGKGGRRCADDYGFDERVPSLETVTRASLSRLALETPASEFGVLVGYRSGLFLVPPSFVDGHPGGALILGAHGGSLEHWWHSVHPVHLGSETALGYLRGFRIGNLADPVPAGEVPDVSFVQVPGRVLLGKIVHSKSPFNAEPREGEFAVDDDQEGGFVRSHRDYPPLGDPREAVVEFVGVDGSVIDLGDTQSSAENLTVDDLAARLGVRRCLVRTVVQCMGNGRKFAMIDDDAGGGGVMGTPWEHALFGGVFGGYPLRDMLLRAAELGINHDGAGAGIKQTTKATTATTHATTTATKATTVPDNIAVRFEGRGDGYTATVLLRDLPGTALLADTVNGEPLSHDHGGPWRVILPGFGGFCNIKGVGTIRFVDLSAVEPIGSQRIGALGDTEQRLIASSPDMLSYVRRWEGKGGGKMNDPHQDSQSNGASNGKTAPSSPHTERMEFAQRTPVTSRLVSVSVDRNDSNDNNNNSNQSNDGVGEEKMIGVDLKGYAHSGTADGIDSVEISVDNGHSWTRAEITRGPGIDANRGPRKNTDGKNDDNNSKSETTATGVVSNDQGGHAVTNANDKHLWQAKVRVKSGAAGKIVDVQVRATDSMGNTQPAVMVPNARGLAHNRIARYKIDTENDTFEPR